MENDYSRDFDLSVSDILLVHKFCYPANSIHHCYPNGRESYGLVYCIDGNVIFKFHNKNISLKSGEFLFIEKDCSYIVENNSDGDFLHITVNFELSNLNTHREFDAVDDNFNGYSILDELLYICTAKKQGYRMLARSLLYKLLYKYFRNLEKSHRSKDYNKILPAKKILDEHYRENISVSELSSACGFSETHFRRLFFKILGCSPTEYRLNKRLTLAKELLRANEFTISEISTYIGFDDSSYFSRIFKAQTGYTPSEFIYTERDLL